MKKNVNPWQIISAIMQALAALFSSLKSSHDTAHEAMSDDAHESEDAAAR